MTCSLHALSSALAGIALSLLSAHVLDSGWLAAAPDGRYAGSLTAIRRMHARKGDRLVPLAELGAAASALPQLFLASADPAFAAPAPATPWPAGPAPQLVAQQAHSDSIDRMAMSRDGRTLVTRSGILDAVVLKVWDLHTNQLVRSWRAGVEDVDISPDGRLLAITDESRHRTRLVDIANFNVLQEWEAIGRRLAFHPRKPMLAFEQGYGIALAELGDGSVRKVLPLNGVAQRIAWSPSGRMLFSIESIGWNKDALLVWFDATTGRQLHSVLAHDDREPWNAQVLAVSPDSRLVAVGDGFNVRIYDTASGTLRHRLQVKRHDEDGQGAEVVESLAFSSDSRQLIGGTMAGPTVIWDAGSGRLLRRLPNIYSATQLAYSTEGQTLIAATYGGLSRFDLASGERIQTLGSKMLSGKLMPSPGETAFLIDVGSAQMWDIRQGTQFRQPASGGGWAPPGSSLGLGRHSFAWSADAKTLAVAGLSSVAVREASTGRMLVRLGRQESPPFQLEANTLVEGVLLDGTGNRLILQLSLQGRTAIRAWDLARKELLFEIPLPGLRIKGMALSPDGKQLAVGVDDMSRRDMSQSVQLFDGRSGSLRLTVATPAEPLAFSPDSKRLVAYRKVLDAETGAEIAPLSAHDTFILSAAYSTDGARLFTGGRDNRIVVWDARTYQPLTVLTGHEAPVTQLGLTGNGTRLVSASEDGMVKLWRLAGEPAPLANFLFSGEGFVIADARGYYYASRSALDTVAFRVGNQAYPMEQFDAYYNRPAQVLTALGGASEALISGLEHARQKRLQRLGLDPAQLSPDLNLPVVQLRSALPSVTRSPTLRFTIAAHDDSQPLESLQVFVNDVPVFGSAGRKLRAQRSLTQEVSLELGHGQNKIQVSVRNARGVESLRESRLVELLGAARRRLYVISIGVSSFKDGRFNLRYAAKDASDVAQHFRDAKGFVEKQIHLLTDAKVTADQLAQVHSLLMRSAPDDLAVVFLAGHGLLDAGQDFHFATYDTDFAHPEAAGLPFGAIEAMLDGIPARSKLLLVDACFSGEADDEAPPPATGLPAGTVRSAVPIAPRLSPQRAPVRALSSELFADLRRGSGAVVIAAASSAQYALESATWNNGVFTSAVLSALKSADADRNSNQTVEVSELRSYVIDQVAKLTLGQQTPVVRRENLAVDFVVP